MPTIRNFLRKFFGKEVPVVKLTADVARQVSDAASKGEKLPFEVDWTSLGSAGYEIFSTASHKHRSGYLDYHVSEKDPDVFKRLVEVGFKVSEGFVSNTYGRTWIHW